MTSHDAEKLKAWFAARTYNMDATQEVWFSEVTCDSEAVGWTLEGICKEIDAFVAGGGKLA